MPINFKSPDFLSHVLSIAQQAGDAIKKIYQSQESIDVQLKTDRSPVTIADLTAHDIIEAGLRTLTPNVAIISEEGPHPNALPMAFDQFFWLVDPLDGTKEFIARTDEFTVNIALMWNHQPVLGVVVVPILNQQFWGVEGQGAFFKAAEANPVQIMANSTIQGSLKVAVSRFHHSGKRWDAFFENIKKTHPEIELIYCGSALKICLVARGTADVYPRFGPTSAWDTAAGHIILTEAGGSLRDFNGHNLLYGHSKSLRNPPFVAASPCYTAS